MLLDICSASTTWSPIHCEVNESKLNSSCLDKDILHHVISNPHFNFMFRLSRHKISKFTDHTPPANHSNRINLVAKTQTTHHLNLSASTSEPCDRPSHSTKLINLISQSFQPFTQIADMAFDHCSERPKAIDNILSSLDRYNPESTTTLQEYVATQCENKFFDQYANLALLKLYVSPLSLSSPT